jgi:hypothetical protein
MAKVADDGLPSSFGPHVGGDTGEYALLSKLVVSDPDHVWERLLEITAETDRAGLYWVGDLIEDLVAAHGWSFAERLKPELERNHRLRLAFVHVMAWTGDDALAEHLTALRESCEDQILSED